MNRFAISLFLLVFAAGAQAQQFRWVDKDGKVQYGDAPPPGVKATPMKPAAGPAVQPASADSKDGKKAGPMTAKEQDEAFRKRQEEQRKAADKAATEQAEAAKKRQNCDSARARLRDLEGGMRIASTNEKGERVYMDDEGRKKEIANVQKSVAEWCK